MGNTTPTREEGRTVLKYAHAGLVVLMALVLVLSMSVPAVALYDPAENGDVDPNTNPAFPQQCGADVMLVIDKSPSLGSENLTDIKTAANSTVDTLQSSDAVSSVGVIEFGTPVDGTGTEAANTTAPITKLDSSSNVSRVKRGIGNISILQGEGDTNWEAALLEASQSENDQDGDVRNENQNKPADVIILISDGDPSQYGYPNDTNSDEAGTSFDEPLEAGTFAANITKNEGTRVIAVGIPNRFGSGGSVNALENITNGSDSVTGVGPQANDYYALDNSDQLNSTLTDIAAQFDCGVSLEKQNDANDDTTFTDDENATAPGENVTYRVEVTNTGTIDLSLDSYFDNKSGTPTLNDSFVGETLEAGSSTVVTFEDEAPPENGVKVNRFNVTASDADGLELTANDTTTVRSPDLTPSITVEKLNDANDNGTFTDDETTDRPGDNVTYRVNVTNDGPNNVTIDSFSDDVYTGLSDGDLNRSLVTTELAPDESVVVTFNGSSPSTENTSKTNTFTVNASDGDGDEATAEDTTTVRSPDLTPSITVTKSVDADGNGTFADTETAEQPGDNVTYRVNVTNVGPNSVNVTDYNDTVYGQPALNQSLDGETIASGESLIVEFEGTAPELEGDSKTNTFSVNATDENGDEASDSDTATVNAPDFEPSITVEKSNDANDNGTFTDDETTDRPGDNVTYRVNVTNNGPNSVNITDYSDDTYALSDSDLSEPLIGTELAPDESVVVTFNGSSPSDEDVAKTNTFSVNATDENGDEVSDSDATTVRSPDLTPSITVEKSNNADGQGAFTDDETAPEPGANVTYRVNVTNDGPNTVTIDSFSDDTYTLSDANLSEPLNGTELAPNESVVVTFEGTAPDTEGDSKTNTFTVSASDDDGDAATDEDTTTVNAPDFTPSITVTKSVDADGDGEFADSETANATGDNVTYRVNVTNDGPNSVNITDYDDTVYDGLSLDLVGETLAPNESAVVTFEGTAPDTEGDSKTNTFSVNATDENGDEANDSDTATVNAPDFKPSITVEKSNDANGDETFTDDETTAQPGDEVTYQVTVTNDGENTVTIDSFSDDTYTLNDSELSQPLVGVMLAPGDSVTVTFNGSSPDTEGASKTNTFTVTASDGNDDEASDSDTTTVNAPDFTPSITVTKSVDADGDGTFADTEEADEVGDNVTYRVNVTNDGPNNVTIDSFSDDVYTGLTDGDLSGSLVGTELAPNESVVVTFEGSAPSEGNSSKTNTFTVDASDENDDIASAEDTATVTTPPVERICPRTPGFWDAHNGEYAKGNNEDLTTDLLPVYLGNESGAKSVNVSSDDNVSDIFDAELTEASSKSNGISKLYIHLLAAKFNERAGPGARVPDNVETTITEADAFLATHDESDWENLSEAEQKQVLEWKDTLDAFNNGEYTDESNCIKDWWKDDEE